MRVGEFWKLKKQLVHPLADSVEETIRNKNVDKKVPIKEINEVVQNVRVVILELKDDKVYFTFTVPDTNLTDKKDRVLPRKVFLMAFEPDRSMKNVMDN